MSHYAVHAPFETDKCFIGNYTDTDKSPQAKAFATLIEGTNDGSSSGKRYRRKYIDSISG